MNRIPKYRVWHKIEKRYVDLRSIDFEKENVGYDAYREGNYYDIASFKDVVFQQFTGFNDVYMKEIYEGDIIEFETVNKKYNGLVAWVTGAFIILGNTMDEDKTVTHILLKDLSIFNYKVKVIGNSYENPKLLK